MPKKNLGLTALLKKTLAVISASTAAMFNMAHAKDKVSEPHSADNNLNVEEFKKRALKSKLVLKLKASNIKEGMLVMHTSHSSHSSHSSHVSSSSSGHYSHTSHASHSSHYSSVPSYTPGTGTKLYTEPKYTPSITPRYSTSGIRKQKIFSTDTTSGYNSSKTLPYYSLGSRTLFKGCRGTDVRELQRLLIKIGYDLTADGYFGETTKVAVTDFQNSNNLTPDGKVGTSTLLTIQIKAL